MVSVADRVHRIRKALDAATRTVAGARWREDEPLVDTVANLTEWPSVLLGSFEEEYLTLPEEVLVTVMRDHQKYFAVESADGKLAPYFLAVLNTDGDPEGLIRHGNERVLRARFNDARFFWNYDQKIPMQDRVEMLKAVTFQKDLGSYHAKTETNLRLAARLADLAEAKGAVVQKPELLLAVNLAKTDLTAELVKEFTELQGIVGGLYARAQGHDEIVAQLDLHAVPAGLHGRRDSARQLKGNCWAWPTACRLWWICSPSVSIRPGQKIPSRFDAQPMGLSKYWPSRPLLCAWTNSERCRSNLRAVKF